MRAALCTEVMYPLYGVERRVYEMAVRLPKYGFETTSFTSTPAKHFPSLHVKQVSAPTITEPPKRDYSACLRYMKNLYTELMHNKFDVIDANGHMSLIPCSLAAKKAKTPAVATIHDLYLTEWGSMYNGKAALFGLPFEVISAKMHFTKLIVLNSAMKAKLRLLGVKEDNVEIIPSGIDTKELDRFKARKKENEILFAGRLVPQKNVDVLLRAFSSVKEARLTIVGEGTEKQRLVKLAVDLDIKDRVTFLDPLPRAALIKRLKSATIFVMPSRRENFGILPLEAMYCSTAVVSTDTEGPRDYIKSGRNGLLVEIGNVRQMADAIGLLLGDKKTRMRLEKVGHKTASSYDWKNIIRKIAALYNKII